MNRQLENFSRDFDTEARVAFIPDLARAEAGSRRWSTGRVQFGAYGNRRLWDRAASPIRSDARREIMRLAFRGPSAPTCYEPPHYRLQNVKRSCSWNVLGA
jgi:hypothetical protein